jgi:hypothetical protein
MTNAASCSVCGRIESASLPLSVCEYPDRAQPTCLRRLCPQHARFFGPVSICSCHEHFTARWQPATVKTAAEVIPKIRALIAQGNYIICATEPAQCQTCHETKELRFGHCFGCARAAHAARKAN